MLNSFTATFDYSAFERKLKHYFSDTAPIYADIVLRLTDVCITYKSMNVTVLLNDTISVKENVNQVVKCCEPLYPKMLDIQEQTITLSEEKIKALLFQGFSFEQIHKKQNRKVLKQFIITRFNTSKNSIDYKEEATGKLFRAHINRPLVTFRNTILRLADNGKNGMQELYQLIVENSQVEELKEKDASLSTNSN